MKPPKKLSTYWTPEAGDVIAIHADLTQLFAAEADPISPPGVRDAGLLSSACARPFTSIGDKEKYPSLVLKCACLTQSLAKNHPFHNGNKRTALASLLTTLHRNNHCLSTTVTDDNVFDFIVSVTADEFPSRSHCLDPDEVIKKIAWWIKKNSNNARHRMSSIRISDFINRCESAGAAVKNTNGKLVIQNHKDAARGKHRSITLSSSTKQLDGQTAAAYVRKLGLNAPNSGIDANEFYDGAKLERDQIRRYIVALRRLART